VQLTDNVKDPVTPQTRRFTTLWNKVNELQGKGLTFSVQKLTISHDVKKSVFFCCMLARLHFLSALLQMKTVKLIASSRALLTWLCHQFHDRQLRTDHIELSAGAQTNRHPTIVLSCRRPHQQQSLCHRHHYRQLQQRQQQQHWPLHDHTLCAVVPVTDV